MVCLFVVEAHSDGTRGPDFNQGIGSDTQEDALWCRADMNVSPVTPHPDIPPVLPLVAPTAPAPAALPPFARIRIPLRLLRLTLAAALPRELLLPPL